jgi:hypothetical protein
MTAEPNSTSITIEIQRSMAEVARLRKEDSANPLIKALTAQIDELAQRRKRLAA